MRIRGTTLILLLLVVIPGVRPAFAQSGQLRAVAERFERDRQALRAYGWSQRIEVRVNGDVKERRLERVHHDRDGNSRTEPLQEESATDERDPIRERRTKKRRPRSAVLDREFRELIHLYTRFTPERMRSAFARASVFPGQGDTAGLIQVQARGVVREGDSMTLWADAVTQRSRKLEIQTSLEGEPVRAVTEFRDLEDGPTYPALTTIRTEAKGKRVVLRTETFDYEREGG